MHTALNKMVTSKRMTGEFAQQSGLVCDSTGKQHTSGFVSHWTSGHGIGSLKTDIILILKRCIRRILPGEVERCQYIHGLGNAMVELCFITSALICFGGDFLLFDLCRISFLFYFTVIRLFYFPYLICHRVFFLSVTE